MNHIKKLNALDVPLTGINLIEASAGTGKTYTITSLFLRLILEKKLSIEKILVVTFTEAATEELRDRLRQRLQDALLAFQQGESEDVVLADLLKKAVSISQSLEHLKMAIRGFDEAAIFTIHGFCKQMLRDHAFESGVLFDTELVADHRYLLRLTVEDFWRQQLYFAPPLFVDWLLQEKITEPMDFLKQIGGDRYLGQPFLILQPNQINEEEKPLLAQQFQQQLATVRHVWAKEQAEVCDYLIHCDDLNRQTYKKEKILAWQKAIDSFLLSGRNSLHFPEEFERFAKNSVKLKKGKTLKANPLFTEMQKLIDIKAELVEHYHNRLLALKIRLFAEVEAHLRYKKQQYNVQFFDDLLKNLHAALNGDQGDFLAKSLRKKFPAALIDEFQDTDPLQYEIFRNIYRQEKEEENAALLFMIGDPKQAIYSFRGADIFAYIKASRTAHQRYTLPINYRSDAPLINAVNALFSQTASPFLFDDIRFNAVSAPEEKSPESGELMIAGRYEEPLIFWFLSRSNNPEKQLNKGDTQQRIFTAVGYEIAHLLTLGQDGKALLENRPIIAADIAILVRTNRQAQEMQKTLIAQHIPSVIYSHESLFSAPEMTDIERILLAIANPAQESLVKAALTTDLLGFNGNDLFDLTNNDQKWQQYLKRFQIYHQLWQERGFIQMYRSLLNNEQIPERLLAYIDGERRLTNVLHAGELLQQAVVTEKLGMAALCRWLNYQKQDATTAQNEVHQLRLESDEKRIKIITIHKSKGLEYPIIFCPLLWDGNSQIKKAQQFTFHDEQSRLILDIGSAQQENFRANAILEEQAENLRLFYVAITRAKHRCYLTWGNIKTAEFSPLAHLLYSQWSAEDFIKLDDATLAQQLQQLRENSNNTIAIRALPQEPVHYQKPIDDTLELTARNFKGKINRNWRVSSFSALTAQSARYNHLLLDMPDYDQENVTDHLELTPTLAPEQKTIFDFPRGQHAGNLMHTLLQYLDFTAPIEEKYIQKQLKSAGYDAEYWTPVIADLLGNILHTPLMPNQTDFKLAAIGRGQRLNELEFRYPLQAIKADSLKNYLRPLVKNLASPLPERIETLQFMPLQGFMKGYIDLVFEYQGKFYLVDYKSNYLGRQKNAYHVSYLSQAMAQHDYFLQSCLYSVALHRYLTLRLPHYSYRENFGGIYYLFLRGMRPEWGADYGVFYHYPDENALEQLSIYLAGQ
ncbi:exodeoxyribonuclease V subunit beta [Thioflexithrix psekupsensis]|uniref:RecBCD enzyme subunit RecB n=2 Tax=Thioflexithrix psekupsensis TaxID=1570016 RepID=A0A251X6M1_9GAMM|nr:exodeoxyribonuclease V subunit beta [Thioflexithrix psekupsensis]